MRKRLKLNLELHLEKWAKNNKRRNLAQGVNNKEN